jgi:DNA-binding transcriptional ArsR family regulator
VPAMLEHLFGSKTRLKLLRTFFREPERPYYVRELTRVLDVQINAVRRELELLQNAGLILEADSPADQTAEQQMRKYYRLNPASLLYPELQALLLKGQVLGEQAFVQDIREKTGRVVLFVLTGRFMNDKRAPSDMLLVGDVKEGSVARLIGRYEKEFGFEIRYTLLTETEFFDRRHIMDKFLYSIFEADHVKVVNDLQV